MLANELADLINEKEQAEVAIVLRVNIFLHLRRKRFHGDIDVVVQDFGADDISGQRGVYLFGHLQGQVQPSGGKT